MSIQKAEMSVEQIENGQIVEHVAYPYVEYEHVAMENGMDIMSMIRDDVSTPMVTHDTTSWRVGQGDSNVSESIVDSSIASMTIKGQTYQNILPSPSLRNSMTNGTTMQKLNEGYDSVNTVDGSDKSAILKGQTLINCLSLNNRNDFYRFGGVKIHDTNYFTLTPSNSWNTQMHPSKESLSLLKPSTTYTLFVYVEENTLINTGAQLLEIGQVSSVGVSMFKQTHRPTNISVGINKFLMTTKSDFSESELGFTFRTYNTVSGVLKFKLALFEGDYTNIDVPYFTGMQSVKLPVLTTTGKNLINEQDIIEGSFINPIYKNGKLIFTSSTSIRGSAYFRVFLEKGKKYVYSTHNITGIDSMTPTLIVNDSPTVASKFSFSRGNSKEFTLDTGYYYVRPYTDLVDNVVELNIQLEQSSSPTSYEPYKSNILSCNEEVTLRGVGDVRDELNLLTGEVVENTIKLTFSGIENWETSANLTNYMTFRLAKPSNMITADSHSSASKYVCDKLQVVSSNTVGSTEIEAIWFSSGHMYIRLPKTKASSLEEFKTYLSTNNIQVVSCAKNPTVKTVDLSILDQDNQPTTQLNSFANGYIQVSSQGLIPSVDYEVPTSNSYHVDLMKANTRYTMKAKSASGTFTIDGTSYGAGTNGTFTTPSSMTNKLLVMSDTAHEEVMILEGDVTSKTIPYFKGIKSAFEDEDKIEVLSTGKNVFAPIIDETRIGMNNTILKYHKGVFTVTGNGDGTSEGYSNPLAIRINVEPNTNYTLSYQTDGVYGGLNGTDTVQTFVAGIVNNKAEYICFDVPPTGKTFNTGEYSQIGIRFDLNKSNTTHTFYDVQLEKEISAATTHETHKSNSTKIPLLSPLRSLPNGVRDEIILDRVNHKAKIVQRVGEDLTQLETPIITEVNLEGYPYVYKGGHIFLNTEVAPTTEVKYSINQAHQIESSNEDILRHQNEINHLYELIAQYVQVQYEAELIDIALQG